VGAGAGEGAGEGAGAGDGSGLGDGAGVGAGSGGVCGQAHPMVKMSRSMVRTRLIFIMGVL